jgi:hypothetical protein
MARTEVRKECPSCGLGVPLEAKVCEFCGWDFEEEDEWISQIEKLEQELITEKQKFDDTAVDKMIKSSLHSSTGQKPAEGEGISEAPPVVVKKKKLSAKGSVQVKIARPLGEDLLAEEKELEEERPAPKPAPTVSKGKSVSIKVDLSKVPPPPEEEFDLEEELAEREKEEIEKVEPSKEAIEEWGKVEAIKAVPPKEPAAAPPSAPATKTRKVRRVVSHPPGTPGQSQAKATTASPKTAPAKPAAAPSKTKDAPAKPAPTKAAPEKEEKKGLFGKFFGGEKEEKPQAKPAPSKSAPTKQAPAAAPAKPQPKMFQCPLCNTMVKEDDKVCPNCGAEFE